MKRLLLFGAITAFAIAFTMPISAARKVAGETSAAPAKLNVCHKTEPGAYNRIVVSSRAWANPKSKSGRVLRAHLRHVGDVIVPGGNACPADATVSPLPSSAKAATITVCHRTGSETTPYAAKRVKARSINAPRSKDGRALGAHLKHANDLIIPGFVKCPAATQARITAVLVPVAGATGRGQASFQINTGTGELCYQIQVSGFGGITAAHIHRQGDGSIVVPLEAPTSGSIDTCTTFDKAILKEVADTPSGFYLNVHSTAFPAGHVRGDLRLAGKLPGSGL